MELDKVAEENEGVKREERLIQMRKEALRIMKFLEAFHPLLIGSVWRGTIRSGSDIDIAVYSDSPEKVTAIIKGNGIKISKTALTTVNKHGATMESFHVYVETSAKWSFEIVIRSLEEKGKKRKCEVFGDELKGLNISELEKCLENNPSQRFIPD